jgi:FdhE protein
MKEPVFPQHLTACYREMEKICLPETAVFADKDALEAWDGGKPLVQYAPPLIDVDKFTEVAGRVFELLLRYLPVMEADLRLLLASLPESPEDRNALVEGLLKQNGSAAVLLAKDGRQVPPDVFGFGFSHVLRLFLTAYARRLEGKVNLSVWDRGECPVCGSNPNFARIDTGGRRYLHCGLCGTDWRFARVACPFCSVTAPETLSFYEFENGLYRIYVCTCCKGYIKTVIESESAPGPDLFWEDIKTVALDITAMRLGFINKTFGMPPTAE